MSLENLNHITRKTSSGADIIVVDNGAVIKTEAMAMLQALHSRSVGGFFHHLKTLVKNGFETFMEKFYVKYGHKSIGDCATAHVFIEGVSMLVAKAMQHWRLYNGQESSTRFLNFSNQKFYSPFNYALADAILENWRSFYLFSFDKVLSSLTKRHPRKEGEDEVEYSKAIRARAFDTVRCFLPAGATTNLAISMNLRQFADLILVLRHHPLAEVREVVCLLEEALIEAYPHSFSKKRYPATEEYNEMIARKYTYFEESPSEFPRELTLAEDTINLRRLGYWRQALVERPAKTELPKGIARTGQMTFEFLLDFASFRDVQRHRSLLQEMPLLTTEFGFNQWYIDEINELCPDIDVRKFLTRQESLIGEIAEIGASPEDLQYLTAMGYNCPCVITGDLHALVYTIELRATRFVHPTLRKIAQDMATILTKRFGRYGLVLHLDEDPDQFDVKRGSHDIVIKD